MTSKRKASWRFLFLVAMVVVMVTAGCGATPEPEVVIETVVVEKEVEGETITVIETVEVEVITEVEKEVEVVVTATPEPTEPKTLVVAVSEQYSENFDITTMVYSMEPHHMIYDTLVSVDLNYEYQPGGLTERWEGSSPGSPVKSAA